MSEPSRRVGIVTGGTKGIGRAVAEALLEAGLDVVVSARTEADVGAVSAELARAADPGRVLGAVCDVRSAADCQRLADETMGRFGRVDVLVNNAGVGRFAPIQELTLDDWQLQIDTNLSGVFNCTKAVVPHLIARGGGWIINIGSLAGRNPFAGGSGYNASKFGLVGLSEAMMLDLRHDGIRVSLVMPGSVDTGFSGRSAGPASWKLASEDVARAVVDLLRYDDRALPSRVELRPTRPPQR